MHRTRVIALAVVVSVLLALLAACSQPNQSPPNLGSPALTPLAFGSSGYDYGEDVAISAKIGAVFVTGSTTGSLDGPNRGGSDGYVRRYNRSGGVVWKRQFGTSENDSATGIAIDEDANVYVVGRTGNNAFIRKFNKNGAAIWTRTFSLEDGHTDARGVHTDKKGHVYVVGVSGGFNPSYVRKYTTSGVLVWTRLQEAGGIIIAAKAVRTDWRGNVYVGVSDVDDDFQAGYILKYNSSGSLLWTRSLGPQSGVEDLEVFGETLYVTGYIQVYNSDEASYIPDAFVSKLNTDGEVLWTRQFGTPSYDHAMGVSIDSQGNAYVTGQTFGSLARSNLGRWDIFVRKYSSGGALSWTKQFGSSKDDFSGDIATLKGSNETYLIGTTFGSIGGSNRGYADAFLRRIDGSDGRAVWTDQ
jgi:hypothetical protein